MSNYAPPFLPTDHASAERIFNTHASKRSGVVDLGYATYLARIPNLVSDGYTYAIVHHRTDIVTFHAAGAIVLNGGGWASRTTANRMDKFTPANIRVHTRGGGLNVVHDGEPVGNAAYGLTLIP